MATALRLVPSDQEERDFAAELQQSTLGCRLRLEKLGTRRALTRDQIARVATEFAADHRSLSASKRLLDTKDPAFRAVVRVQSEAVAYWHSVTIPFPEPGVRLIRQGRSEEFDERMRDFRFELDQAVAGLQRKYAALRAEARTRLGTLFNEADYPERVDDAFALEWEFPSYEPPDYLRRFNPQLYAQECTRIRNRFDEAVRLTEEAFLGRLNGLVAHLAERLSGETDGKPKVFRNSAVENLNDFFEEFRSLDIGSNAELQDLVARAQRLINGVSPDALRSDFNTRSTVANGLAEIQQTMDALMVPRPTRAISLVEDEAA